MRPALTIVVLLAACAGTAPRAVSPFRFVERDGALRIVDGEAPVLEYVYVDRVPDGVPARMKRSGYVHPIWGLDGEVLTDDFPRDHLHHRGLSLMWPRMKVGDHSCELWHIRRLRTRFDRWLERRTEADHAVLVVRNHWVLDETRAVANETLRLVVHAADGDSRTIEVEYRLEALAEPIEILGQVDKGYGGLNLRFAPRADTVITTDQGRQAKDSDLGRFAWADLSARFGGRAKPSGITVIVDPAHPGFPPGWTLRHYGDLNPAWPGPVAWQLRPGTPLRLPYRLLVHSGPPRADAARG